ncbi:hemagglutinin repeat-containing protein [Comamonas sp. 17RB]|uniref:beta strand repeat-containing protein n=1 Tax=Comamonas sp. 17RB TaxID=3047025 RepID=UPI0024B84DB7|nr:hemagglutinin repeat-containing protein [Comamonas sp. 17RB]MDI9855387.1 hemagglutinin repeat-containing protein [Comamonas sp. 17RB]
MLSGGALNLTTTQGIDNQGSITGGSETHLVSAGDVTNGSASNSDAFIVNSGNGMLQIQSGALSNHGAIHSNGGLAVQTQQAAGITNHGTGGLSSLGDLGLDTSGVADIRNAGALYAGGAMNLLATGRSIDNQEGATIDSDGKATFTSADFRNYAQIRVASLDINTSREFFNGLVNVPTIKTDFTNRVVSDQDEADRVIMSWEQSGCASGACDGRWVHQDAVTIRQTMVGTLPSVKPQILVDGALNINYGSGSATNRAGLISANKIDLQGSGVFTNEDFYLYDITYYRRATTYEYNPVFGDSDYTTWYPQNKSEWDNPLHINGGGNGGIWASSEEAAKQASLVVGVEKTRNVQSEFESGAGIFATTLTGNTGGIVNRGSKKTVSTETRSKDGVNVGSAKDHTGTTGAAGTSATVNGTGAAATTSQADVNASGPVSASVNGASAATVSSKTDVNASGAVSASVNAADAAATSSKTDVNAIGSVSASVTGAQTTGTKASTGASGSAAVAADGVQAAAAAALTAAEVLKRAGSVSLGGFVVNFPTNPNGYFVPTQNPQSQYLVETNPRFSVGTASMGSDYLEKRLGYNPDVNIKRLGDANYEAELIRQQLINETGRNLLAGNSNEAAQIQSFMDHAATQATALGLEYGKPLTASQVAGLTSDIVWMEVIDVGGINVLAPRVYLSAASKAMITGGAVIAADDINLKTASLTNTGGTIVGGKSLQIESTGDVTNISGTIKGGNVQITSTEGSIINQTHAVGQGDALSFHTDLGKTAVIEATGSLKLDAGKDITVLGANVIAGSDASLTAKGAVTFDTIVDKSTTSTVTSSSTLFGTSSSSTTTTTERNIGSSLVVGGDLAIASGKDTTFAGSQVRAGSLAVDTQGDLNVLARQDTTTSRTVSNSSGLGVGGGVYGMETKTTDSFKSMSAGSAIDVAGNATVTSAGTTTLQGSALNVGGDANITSKQGIQVVDAMNIDRTKTVTETTTFLKLTDSSDTKTESEAKAGAAQQKAKASASAGAEASNESSLRLMEASTTTETKSETTSAGSSLNVGGNLTAKTDGTLTIQGSKVSAGGDVALEAKSIDVLAGRNEKVETSDTTRTSIGFYSESNASAEAEAQASAKARGLAANAGASAEASAGASSTLTVGAKHEQESSSERTVTNTSSTIQSGGNMSIAAKGDATFVGATVESGGNLDVSAKSITNKAAQDTQEKTTSSSSHLAGVYIGTAAEANVAAEVNLSASTGVVVGGGAGDKDKSDSKGSTSKAGDSTAAGSKATASTAKTGSDDKTAAAKDSGGLLDETGLKADAGASASASAEATAGLRYQNKQESETEGSVTQVTNSFTAKGSITRTATDTITDQGTQMEAGKNINQTARVINDEAVSDSTYSSKDAQSHDARIGAYAGASASASASVEGKASVTGKVESEKPEVEAGASAGLGVKASYTGSISSESESSTTAVTSRYKAGGDIASTSQEKTTLSGTEMEAGGNVSLVAGSLDYNAAKDTKTSSKNEHDIAGQATVRVIGTAGADVGLSYDGSIESESATTARAGSIKSGGDTRITTKGDANFTGTDIASGGKTAVNAGGDVNFNAAQSTTDSSSHEIGVSVNVSSSKKSDSVGAEANYDMSIGSSNTAKGSSITSGGGVEISSGKSVTLEGTGIESKGDVSISARDKVDLKAAVSSETNVGLGIGVAVEAKTKKEGAAPSSADSKSDNKTGTDSAKKAEPAKQEQTTKTAEAGKTAEDGAEEDKNKKKAETGVGVDFYSGTESTSTSISSTGKISIKAGTVVNQEAKLEGAEGTSVEGKQVQKSAVNGAISLGVNAGVSTGD